MKKFLICCLSLFTLIFSSSLVSAHSGGGPPFVKVNNKYAATNPLFQGAPTEKGMTIPQDISPGVYVVNTPLTLSVDTTQLGIDPGVAKTITFSWSFTKGQNLTDPIDTTMVGEQIEKKVQPSRLVSYYPYLPYTRTR